MLKSLSVRSVVSVVLVLLTLGIGAAGFRLLYSFRKPPDPREYQDPPLNVEVFQVTSHPLREYLEAFGTARADREVVVSAEVSGKVVQVLPDLEVGQQVNAKPYPKESESGGAPSAIAQDRLILIEQFGYEQRRRAAEARFQEADADVKKLATEKQSTERLKALAVQDYNTYLAEYKRKKDLIDKGVGSKAELSNYELNLSAYEKSKEQLENQWNLIVDRETQVKAKADGLKAEWELAEQDLSKTEVLPPFDGYLSEVNVELGQYVRVGDPLVRLTDLSQVEIPIALTSQQYLKLKPALDRGENPVALLSPHRDSESNRQNQRLQWNGRVVRVSPEANERTRTIQAYIIVDNKTQQVPLLPGTFVFARIEGPVHKNDNLFAVPRDAIFKNNVFVVEGELAKIRTVGIVDTLQSFALIESGLTRGDKIVLTNLDILRDGDQIKPGEPVRTLETELEREGNLIRSIEIESTQVASDPARPDVP